MIVVAIVVTLGRTVPQPTAHPELFILLLQPLHLFPQDLILSHHLPRRCLDFRASSDATLFVATDLGFEFEDVLLPSGTRAALVVSDSGRAV